MKMIKSRRMRRVGNVVHMWDIRTAYKILVENPEDKSPHGRPRYRWEDIIKMDLRETVFKGMDWIHLA
jgi:hypothetical protein